jgi:hypothetical protein
MADDISKETKKQLDDLASKCSKKLGISTDTIVKHFMDDLARVKKQLPDLDKKVQEMRAFVTTQSHYKQELRSPAVFFEGVVLGASEPFDMVAKRRSEARKLFVEDPKKAIVEGYTDEKGTPLDSKETYGDGSANRNFGKPLPETDMLQNIIGICREKPGAAFRMFIMQFGDNLAGKVNIPMFVPTKFRANPKAKQGDPDELALNPYSKIEFTLFKVEGFNLLEVLPTIKGLNKMHTELGEIEAFHAKRESLPMPKRLMITEADIQHIAGEPNQKTGNIMIVLSDPSLPEDSEGITCWLPETLHQLIDFGAGSRVLVLGTTQKSNFQEKENHLMNLWGIYADPKLKMSKDEGGPAVTRGPKSAK